MSAAAPISLAHAPIDPSGVWTSWTFDPLLVLILAGAAWLYARGVRRLWAKARERGVRARQVVAFYAALATIAVALMSPLEAVASSLVSGHMLQHLLLLVPAPVLLVYAAPALVLYCGLPARARTWTSALRRPSGLGRRAYAVLSGAAAAVTIHAAAMWAWHLPGPYNAAVTNELLHATEHATFLWSALLFWTLVVRPHGRRSAAYPIALLSVFTIWMLSGGLGALLTFSANPLYLVLGHHATDWGLSALADQQLAGAVMWVPAGFAYLATMAVLFVRWMGSLERAAPKPAEVPR
jgi:putative membrane protein